jgi:hypothetical protein
MANVFVIWEEIPETTKFYLLGLEGAKLKKVLKAHNQLVNSTNDSKAAEALMELLENEKPFPSDKAFEVKGQSIDYIVWSGFLL